VLYTLAVRNIVKAKLQQEQEKLLTINVELAVETKQLLLNQKEWKSDKQVRKLSIEINS
jgi:hypothetical protein